jgi:hypothetical protein
MKMNIPNFIRVVVVPQQVQGMAFGAIGIYLNMSQIIAIKGEGELSNVVVSEETTKDISQLCFQRQGIIKEITTDLRPFQQS